MSRSMLVLVATDESLEGFAYRLGELLGKPVNAAGEGEPLRFELPDDQVDIAVYENDFENDRDLNFEDFQHAVSQQAWRLRGVTPAERAARQEGFARRVFDLLRETGRYGLMLTDDVDRKVDEFRAPDRQSAP
jgi:hypothetical protein